MAGIRIRYLKIKYTEERTDLGTDPIYNGDLGLDPDPFNYTIDSQSYIFINTLNDVGRTK